ncbi:uncharacterized protein N7482_003327 [Penicillium canariense]|uniref:Uncharacterized protein n=1 Tax=Penicillium canariense TaxID=189055 RepID=A0A9W9I6H1_9EURO|nr:uncharacterized protein N7482_003327 [Penicillium canariense]KAJ5167733.1 hypothetical protein N7482_003327 [Penicillium canariense]
MHYFILALLGMLLPLFAGLVQANVEKTIFLAPPAATIPSEEPDFDDLGLERLSPQSSVVRTQLNASFPTAEAPEGTDSWFFLENLTPGQRYEVRVCWLATQPTAFTLTTHPLAATIEDSTFLSSLSVYATARLAALDARLQANSIPRRASGRSSKDGIDPAPTTDSILFLRVRAAADYFSTDEALMRDVPPVTVDLILDPFLWNLFPRSLVPTAGWIVAVAVVAAVVARWVVGEFGRVIEDARQERDVQGDKKER